MNEQQDFIAELLSGFRERNSKNEAEKNYDPDHLVQLQEACNNLLSKESFEVGQIVQWKKNLQNRRLPHKNQPAIVVKILDEPVISTDNEAGSPYFLEKLDIVLGVMSNDDTFLTFYYDSSRFEPYREREMVPVS